MLKTINSFFWIILIIGVIAFVTSLADTPSVFNAYKFLLEFSLFGFSAFLVFKRDIYFRMKADVEVIRLVDRSNYYVNFLWYGIILSGVYLFYVNNYGSLVSFSTLLIAVLLLYYVIQIMIHANPSLYIDSKSFIFDNYFIERWNWDEMQRIEIEGNKLRLISARKDFELDFDRIDQMDYGRLKNEIDRKVLDGIFTNQKSSKQLLKIIENQAALHGVTLKRIA